jgi:RNA polymerase sigma factor (sigma-70 family)
LVAAYVLLFEFLNGEAWMPPLSRVESPEKTIQFGTPLDWLTPWHCDRAIEAGAVGVMHKATPMRDLMDAVRCLAAGEQLLSQQEVIEALRRVVRERERDHESQLAIAKLTPREREVLQAIAEGLSDKEIAERFHVGVGTVHSHVTNILSKLGLSSRLQALVFALRYGIVAIE